VEKRRPFRMMLRKSLSMGVGVWGLIPLKPAVSAHLLKSLHLLINTATPVRDLLP
jgi:hypothetical protein